MFDYGAPVGFNLAVARPDRVTGILSQNGNAYGSVAADSSKQDFATVNEHFSAPCLFRGGHRGRRPFPLNRLRLTREVPWT